MAVVPLTIPALGFSIHPAALLLDHGAFWGRSYFPVGGRPFSLFATLMLVFLILPYLLKKTILFLVILKNSLSVIQIANLAIFSVGDMTSISRVSSWFKYNEGHGGLTH